MSAKRYWKANKRFSREILKILERRVEVIQEAKVLAEEYGANPARIYTNNTLGRYCVAGFTFKDETKVDHKLLRQVKGTCDGWRPRRSSGKRQRELDLKFGRLQAPIQAAIAGLIGMDIFTGGGWRVPGAYVVDDVVYLTTTDDVTAKGCTRISDLEYEKVTSRKKRKKKVKA